MSITAAILSFIAVAVIYVGVIFLSRAFPHSGRYRVNPLWGFSDWNQQDARPTKTCIVPSIPGNCVIEGWTGAIQPATRTCNAPSCIGFDGTIIPYGQSVGFTAACDIPFCGWSQCILTFGDNLYLNVTRLGQDSFKITGVPKTAGGLPTLFYMLRQEVSEGVPEAQQNGTIAQFFILPPADGSLGSALLMLGYNNTATLTTLEILNFGRPVDSGGVDMFVLMEEIPQTISNKVIGPATNVVTRKILAFGGGNRTSNPPLDVQQSFSTHNQTDMWNAINSEPGSLRIIHWYSNLNGYNATTDDNYIFAINDWKTIPSAIVQNVVESRLLLEVNGSDKPFYLWQG